MADNTKGPQQEQRIVTDDGDIVLSQAANGGLHMRSPGNCTLNPTQSKQFIDKAQGLIGGSQRDRS